jgi:hypothetical protein
MKEENYKLQNTNYKQIPNYKFRITKKEAFFYSSPLPNKQYPTPMDIFNVFVILSLWFVCNLYFVICNFGTLFPSPLANGGKNETIINQKWPVD